MQSIFYKTRVKFPEETAIAVFGIEFAGLFTVCHDIGMASDQREIYPLTSLRFFAAGLVVLEHLQMLPGLEWVGFKNGFPGLAGVSIFFVLSGFILSYTYWNRDWVRAAGPNSRDFFWSRFARVYPLHWLMFLMALPLGLNSNTARVEISKFPWLLTLTDRLWPGFPIMMQPVKAAWTLSCEALFYLATPFLFMILCRRRNPLIAAFVMLVTTAAIVFTLGITLPEFNWTAYLRLPDFLLGIAAFQLSKRVSMTHMANALLLGGLLLLAIGTLTSLALFPTQFLFLSYAPGACLLILGFAHVTGRTARWLSRPGLVLLGHSSYALYLIHDPALRYIKVLLNRNGTILTFPWSVLFGLGIFGLVVMASIICFNYYENPVRLKLRSLFKRKPDPKPVDPSASETALT